MNCCTDGTHLNAIRRADLQSAAHGKGYRQLRSCSLLSNGETESSELHALYHADYAARIAARKREANELNVTSIANTVEDS